MNNQRLYHKTEGHGPHLVLLHGWGFNAKIWQPLLAQLCSYFTVTTIDLPGYGNSKTIQSSYQLLELAKSIVDLIPDQAIYLGWSLGGLIAMAIARYFPQHISQLICVASSPCFSYQENWPGIKPEILQQFSASLSNNYKKTLQGFLNTQLLSAKNSSLNRRELISNLTSDDAPNQTVLQQGLTLLMNTDLRTEITKVSCDQLYILGNLDSIVPATTQPVLQTLVPHAKIIMLQAAHLPFLSHSDDFLKLVINHVHSKLH